MNAPAYAAQFKSGDPVIVEFRHEDGSTDTRTGIFSQARATSLWIMPTSGPAAHLSFVMTFDWGDVVSVTAA